MEVLQVERVVPSLVVSLLGELLFSALELNWENGRTYDQDDVDATTEPGDVELKVNRAREADERGSEDLNLLFPRPCLFNLERCERMRRGELTQNRVWRD